MDDIRARKMKRNRLLVQQMLRKTHLLSTVDNLRYIISLFSNYPRNRAFAKEHPEFFVPPAFLAFDAYSAVDWPYYYKSGESYARKLAETFTKYSDKDDVAIMEWGCGPGRIIRHMNKFIPDAMLYGTDYNVNSIKWCAEYIPDATFLCNHLAPPLIYDEGCFDFIYVHSVFTHLSVEVGLAWMTELKRVLKVGGMLYFTTHSDGSAQTLLSSEYAIYRNDGVYVRGRTREGKKMFGTWHTPDYVKNVMLGNMHILEHLEMGNWQETGPQDGWFALKVS